MMKNLLTTLVFWFKNSFSWLFCGHGVGATDRHKLLTAAAACRQTSKQQSQMWLGIVCDNQFTSRIYDVADVAIASVYIPNCRRPHNRASAKPGSTDCCSFCCAALPPLPPQAHPTKKIIRRWSSISARLAGDNMLQSGEMKTKQWRAVFGRFGTLSWSSIWDDLVTSEEKLMVATAAAVAEPSVVIGRVLKLHFTAARTTR